MVFSAQTVQLSYIKISTISKCTETRFYRPMSPSNSIVCVQNDLWACGTFGTNSAPILHQHCLQTDWNEIPDEPHDLGVSSGACKMISEPLVCSAQIVHLSSINIKHYLQMDRNEYPLEPRHLGVPPGASKTISEHMVLWRKPCTYLALTVTLSANGAKWDSTRPTSPRCFIGCV
jgi:hypothetical protein